MGIGKDRRLKKIIKSNEKSLIVPMDHGFTMGPIHGLENIEETIKYVFSEGADGVILHKGLVKKVIDIIPKDKALGIHLNAGTNMQKDPSAKIQVCSIEQAMYWGADFVSYHLNIGNENETRYLKELMKIQEECNRFGIPLLGMIYSKNVHSDYEFLHCIRVAEELGLDMVKIWCPDNLKIVRKATDQSQIPIFIAGGESIDGNKFVAWVKELFTTGIAGLAAGRNIFGSNNDILKRICKIEEGGIEDE